MQHIFYGFCGFEHNYCIIDTVSEFMNRGFSCYLEYEIPLDNRKRGYRVVVDILAKRANEEILVEVGTLSSIHGDRLKLLRMVKPKAKIFHVTQWKNWLTRFDYYVGLVSVKKMGESLAKAESTK